MNTTKEPRADLGIDGLMERAMELEAIAPTMSIFHKTKLWKYLDWKQKKGEINIMFCPLSSHKNWNFDDTIIQVVITHSDRVANEPLRLCYIECSAWE
jgi:hypothetical protein